MTAKYERPFHVSTDEYPFSDHWFERDGVAVHYVDEGEGPPVVMFHGNPTWSFLYRKIIKGLKGKCRCIAADYPGFGFSQHPPNYNYTPQEQAEWTTVLLDSLNLDPFIIVIQDWGGPIGLSIAVDQPDRIAGMVICNTWCWPPDMSARIFSMLMGGPIGKYLHLQRNFFAKKIVPSGIYSKEAKTEAVLKAYTDPFPTPKSRMGTYVFPGQIRFAEQWLKSIEDRLHVLKEKPKEMVWAMKDMAFGKEPYINRWLNYFPGTPVERHHNASHYLQEDIPNPIIAAIERVLRM